MSSEALIDKILAARRPGGWETVGDWEFYVEALTELDYMRIRAACTSVTVDDQGRTIRKFNSHELALGWLDAVTNWRRVTAGAFSGANLSDDERGQEVPFSPRLLRALFQNRAKLLDELVGRAMVRHRVYLEGEAADAKN